jgi:predicted Zn-dependent protease
LLATLGALTWAHIPRFASDVASLEHAYKTFPGWRRAAFDYTDALVEAGYLDRATEMTETEPSFSTPPWVRDYFRGWILLERGDSAAAQDALTRASHIAHLYGHYPFPDLPLARALVAQGQTERARVLLEGVVRAQIRNPLGQQMAQRLLTEIDAKRNDTR